MTADMPLAAPTVKGRVRVKMWRGRAGRDRAGRISGVTEVRGVRLHQPAALDCWSSRCRRCGPAARRGCRAPLDVPHTFTYTGDVARALIALGRDERAWGRAWHVPVAAAGDRCASWSRRTARVGGFAEPTVRGIPGPVMYASGWFNKFAKEMREMRYQFDRPFVLDSSETEAVFGLRPTGLDEALAATIRERVTT